MRKAGLFQRPAFFLRVIIGPGPPFCTVTVKVSATFGSELELMCTVTVPLETG